MIALLHLHPSIERQVREGNTLSIEHLDSHLSSGSGMVTEDIPSEAFIDSFGNRCTRFVAPAGRLRLSGMSLVEIDGHPDAVGQTAQQAPIEELPPQVLRFLLPSRYCEVDRFQAIAQDLFGSIAPGWTKAVAIRDWVHEAVRFNYQAARPTKTAMDVYTERIGVCRDFQHLAVTLTRCQNIPARYVTGHLGDIRWPYSGPGDFSAWYEVWLDGRWWTMDARHNESRIGRLLVATGRDAADVAITTSFGEATLQHFWVESNEARPDGTPILAEGAVTQAGAA
ncbi:MAG TPA: transglutaminase family protein [Acidobacteriaceae bacterium]|nr:transglutaminase family protein [Acidobacteriaceae bacterium]